LFRIATAAALLAAAVCPALAGKRPDPPYFVRKKTWQDTLLASREALMHHEAEEAKRPDATPKKGPVALGTWYVIEPFYAPENKKVFGYAFPPEKELAREGGDVKAALAKSYGKLSWKPRPDLQDGVVHGLRAGGNGASYLCRTLTAAKPTTITGFFGGDDGILIWLNGKLVYSEPGPRGIAPNQDKVKLRLHAGANHLLLKIPNYGGRHGFYFHTRPKPVGGKDTARNKALDELWKHLDYVYRKETIVKHEMACERRDRIWDAAWTPGSYRELARRYAKAVRVPTLAREASALAARCKTLADLGKVRAVYYRGKRIEQATAQLKDVNFEAIRLAIADLSATFPEHYTKGKTCLARADALEKKLRALRPAAEKGDAAVIEKLAALGDEVASLRREALLANPLLDFDRILLIRRRFGDSARKVISRSLGMPSLNSHVHTAISNYVNGWDNEIAILSDLRGEGRLQPVFKPEGRRMVCDVDLHFDADRMLFSMPGTHNMWQIFQLTLADKKLEQLTPRNLPDVDHFDACYMPNGRIAFTSTAGFQGLPCEYGGKPMAQLFLMDADGGNIRQITFEQDSDWCPTMKNDGRLMYLRWEYTDTPHYFTRILFHCNPDGTEQMELYGSNSYFPNAFLFARPLPDHPSRVVGIAGGHHGISRSGRLLILDPALGRHEADGVVQEIPGRGKPVEPIIRDRLVDGVWPQFLHPYPLSSKYFVVSAKLRPDSLWGIYLVDVFDNMTLIKEVEGEALLEPLPFRKTAPPPVIHDKVDLRRKDAVVYLTDVYRGNGLAGVPRGAVKRLRLFAYHFAYNKRGGHSSVGIESSWDIKRVLGTVPVEADGSASFRIPANTPIAVQPLDAQGRALQLMRSWFVGMPGEIVSCVGCHEMQADAPVNLDLLALRRAPSEIEPWYGPPRPFGFETEVQPVLDRYCIACHNGEKPAGGKRLPDFTDKTMTFDERDRKRRGGRFSAAYAALQPYVRRQGPEGDYHMCEPMEYHASTSELLQMFEKGHHNVRLDREAMERIYTWIDLNAPYVAHWAPPEWRGEDQRQRRLELARRYANVDTDPEAEYHTRVEALSKQGPIAPVKPAPTPHFAVRIPQLAGWPFDAAEAKRRQAAAGEQTQRTIDLGGGVKMEMVLIPAGEFVMGDPNGYADERPLGRVTIAEPFWMGVTEVTNAQFARFDPIHDSRYIDRAGKDHANRGFPANDPGQPVIRVTWQQAMAFCQWLTSSSGEQVSLPTEAQWEWACRAGTATPLWYGGVGADFARFANLADASGGKLRTTPFPTIGSVNDRQAYAQSCGAYEANAWGLKDMHGGVSEWTLSTYRPYPYVASDGRNDGAPEGRKVARGGSWRDRPHRARSAFRLPYQPWQPVVNVGFRVICKVEPKVAARSTDAAR